MFVAFLGGGDRCDDIVKFLGAQAGQDALERNIHALDLNAGHVLHDDFKQVGAVANDFAVFHKFKRRKTGFSANDDLALGLDIGKQVGTSGIGAHKKRTCQRRTNDNFFQQHIHTKTLQILRRVLQHGCQS